MHCVKMDHRCNKLSHVAEILSCSFNSTFSHYTHFPCFSIPNVFNSIGLYFKIHNTSNIHKESSQICVLASYTVDTPDPCLKSRSGCTCFLYHLPVCWDAISLNPEDIDQRGWCREALDSQAVTDAMEGWEWELPEAFLWVSGTMGL